MSELIRQIRRSALDHPEQPAILCDARVVTHRRFGELTDRVADGLLADGIKTGDRVGLYFPNCPEFALIYVGILKAGGVVVPLNLLINQREIAYILNDAGVGRLLAHHSLSDRVDDLCRHVSSLERIHQVSGIEAFIDELMKGSAARTAVPKPADGQALELAVILYTSGTTGFPKGAMLTHANLAANVRSVHLAMRWRSGRDRVLVVLPMFHAFAATVGMLTPLSNGCAMIPVPRFEPEAVAEAIHRRQATLFLGVPSMYGVMLRLREEYIPLLASLRFGIVGGAAMPVSLLRQFEDKFGVRLYEGDGPTECSPVTCVNPIDGVTKPGTVGLPVPCVEMKIVDESGQEVPTGQVGEIAVRGPNVMKGYWNQPQATAEVFLDGWFLTGDLGTCDVDGYFSIVDRKKDLIIVNGMNVYPRMIEEVLHDFPGMREVAVVGEANARHGEVPVAFVVIENHENTSERDLRDYCRGILGRHQIPKRFVFLPELPKNAAGKVLKRELCRLGEVERGVRGLE